MQQASVRVDITLRDIGGVWKVDLCMVWYAPKAAQNLGSGEDYLSAGDAIVAMKRRTMTYLRESGRTETEQQVHWQTSSIADDGTVLRNHLLPLEPST
jgi:hypothetical protein